MHIRYVKRHLFLIVAFLFSLPLYANDLCHERKLDQCSLHSRPLSACQDSFYGPLPTTNSNQIAICHRQYFVAANRITKTSDYVAYHLTPNNKGTIKRADYFCPDPCLKAGERSELDDYRGLYPVFNRGHLNPAADNSADIQSYMESFFLSNMVPQQPDNNGGIWNDLEKDIDLWAQRYGELYIITGPIYDYAKGKHQEVGNDKVWAPAALFKIIYAPRTQQVLAFIIPNEALPHSQLRDYLVSIESINQATRLKLMTSLEHKLLTERPKQLWPL